MDEFLWLDSARLINLSQIAYIDMKDSYAAISFANGEKLMVKGDAFEELKSHLASLKLDSVAEPKAIPGFKSGRLT